MHPAERIAAYLADELPADEREAFEAELARDPALRVDLEAVRAADAALGEVPATSLPTGAEDRLRAALAPELDRHLGEADEPPEATEGVGAGRDELAPRRAARAGRRFPLRAVGGMAAALVGVAVIGTALQDGIGGGADSGEESAVSTSGEAAPEALDAPAADRDAAEDAADGAAVPDGPTLIAGDRELDADGVDELLAAAAAADLTAARLSAEDAGVVGREFALALDVPPVVANQLVESSQVEADALDDAGDAGAAEQESDGELGGEPADDDAAATDDGAAATDEGTLYSNGTWAFARESGAVDDTDRERVATCLTEVLDAGGGPLVPVAAELVVFEGRAAIAYTLVGVSPETGAATRPEVWVLDRETCDVLRFRQG